MWSRFARVVPAAASASGIAALAATHVNTRSHWTSGFANCETSTEKTEKLRQELRRKTQMKDNSKPVRVTDEFLKAIPKTDLHVHLDGSIRLSTLIELAKTKGIQLPCYNEAKLRQQVFKPSYKNLEEYLQGFIYTTAVMQDAASVERIAYEFAVDNYNEGVRYFEVRYAPQLHASADGSFDICAVNAAVDRGLRRARDEFNARLSATDKWQDEPMYDYGIINCAMRMIFPGMSRYFDALAAVHPNEPQKHIRQLASFAMVRSAVASRQNAIPVVGIDIAGAENQFEAKEHVEAFKLAQKHFINKTVHAGEGAGPESINQAVRDLYAERIGHGFHVFSNNMVESAAHKADDNGEAFCRDLLKWVCDKRICFEVCLTSNLQTMPELTIKDHVLKNMLAHNVGVAICTDNRLVSSTTTTNELRIAVDEMELTPKQLRDIVINGFKRSFYPGAYDERRAYVRKVTAFYDRLAKEHGVPLA